MQQRSIDRLAHTLVSLENNTPLSPDLRNWLIAGIKRSLHRAEPLGQCLGIERKSGCRSLQSQVLMHQRDRHIMHALALVALNPHLSTWERCCRLHPIALRFVNFEWKHCRYEPAPPERLTAIQAALWHACETDQPLPKTANGLWKLATRFQFRGNKLALILLSQHLNTP